MTHEVEVAIESLVYFLRERFTNPVLNTNLQVNQISTFRPFIRWQLLAANRHIEQLHGMEYGDNPPLLL